MKLLCVDPIFKRTGPCSIVALEQDCTFLYHQVSKKAENLHFAHYADSSKYVPICYDALRSLKFFGVRFAFLYDVKVLYELKGYSFKGLFCLIYFNQIKWSKYT